MKQNNHSAATKTLLILLLILFTVTLACCDTEKVSETTTEAETIITDINDNNITPYDESAASCGLSIDADNVIHDISPVLYGVFFEDINFAADGGLYAEMAVNRSFEFTSLAENDSMYGWSTTDGITAKVISGDTAGCLNVNNPSYISLNNAADTQTGIANRGFLDTMAIEKGQNYNFSVYAKSAAGYDGEVTVRFTQNGSTAAEGHFSGLTDSWQKYSLILSCTLDANENVRLELTIGKGSAEFDMVSLFPENTFMGRCNGLRADLAQKIAELKPAFLRFPGGCVTEGTSQTTAYSWKASVGADEDGNPVEFNGQYGDIAARAMGTNLWTDLNATDDKYPSFMTYGLGFYEYFQFAEDIGALGVPVLNCGLYCQMRGCDSIPTDSELFGRYVQDMLDLVEFCRGDENSTWGKVRVSLGHSAPFQLRYICIGNENEGEDYFIRYELFLNALNNAKEENPELYGGIELIYSSGASDATHSGNYILSYENAEKWLSENPSSAADDFAGATDQHYYNEPSWFLKNTDYYDEKNYKRSPAEMTDTVYGGAISVFLGEYAAKSNTMEAALAEAAYMTGLERNSDIVKMAAYAPLFGNLTATHWAPDLIWFSNNTCTSSVNYYVQKLFSVNAGTQLLHSELTGAKISQSDLAGKIGVGTWYTSAEFDNIKVTDNISGAILAENDFSVNNIKEWERPTDGKFKISGGRLTQKSTEMDYSDTGSVAYFGDCAWSNYTYTLEAVKLSGEEGFLIPFAVNGKNDNYFWNIGGWQNTVSCLQQISGGVKSGQIPGTVKSFTVEENRTYLLKIVAEGTRIMCYIDGELYIDYKTASDCEARVYETVASDSAGDIIIKLVNVTPSSETSAVKIAGIGNAARQIHVSSLHSDSKYDENKLSQAEKCTIEEFTLSMPGNEFNFTLPPYSITVIRIPQE